MRMNKLALAMMLLAGGTSVSTAMAAESTAAGPAVNTLIQPDQQPASSEAPAVTATHEASQQADDSVATTPSNPGSAEQPSVAAVPEASAAPVSQEAAASAPV